MATEHIPQIDNLIKDFGERFREDVKQANKAIERAINGLKKNQESEEKSMLHNVTVKHGESKILEQIWEMQAFKRNGKYTLMTIIGSETCYDVANLKIKEKELDHEPTPDEIAQFLFDAKADFVSVVQNYRFENELPF